MLCEAKHVESAKHYTVGGQHPAPPKKQWGTIVCWYLQGESSFSGFRRWCRISSIHSSAHSKQGASSTDLWSQKPPGFLPRSKRRAAWLSCGRATLMYKWCEVDGIDAGKQKGGVVADARCHFQPACSVVCLCALKINSGRTSVA